MKKIHILLFAMAAMAAASCSEKEEYAPSVATGSQVQREFSAITTKTALQDDGATVVWETSDAISVFDGTSNNKFDIKDYTSPSASAKFEGTTEATATEFYAVYPYAAENTLDGNKVSGTVPAAQTAKTGSFDYGAAVAYTDADAFAFHNVTALIGVKLSSSQNNVSSIVLTGNCGESVAGAVTATLSSAGAVSAIASSSTGSKSVTLSGTFAAGGMYYLAFIPQNFSEGITVTANYSDGKSAKLVSSLDWDAEAGKSYNVVDFGTAAYLEFEAEKFTFDYGESKVVSFSGKNIASVDGIALPAGWTASELGTSSVKITAPVKTVVVENAAGTVYKPVGDAVLTVTTNASATKNASVKVRLRGINSSEEFNEFRTLYQNGSGSFSGSGVSYARRLNDCVDYLVDEEITLNDDISASPENSDYKYYILHHIEHNLNGNGKTFTMNVAHNAWPIGFCQTIFGTVKVHDLKLAGTINWTYSAAGSNAGCCGGFAGYLKGANTVSLTLENVENSVNITWTSASTADPTVYHAVGGFVGVSTNKPVTFVNCTYSGKITKNCRSLAEGGFVGWNSGTSVSKFDGCSFSGEIESTATTSKSAYTATTTLEFFGGFVGASDGQASALMEFKGCESAGTIKIAGGAREVGGFVGKSSCPNTFADNAAGRHCVFSGNIEYTETEAVSTFNAKAVGNIGGFVGYKTGSTLSFDNCVFSPEGKVKVVDGAYDAGGYVGVTDATLTITGCSFGGAIYFKVDPSAAKNSNTAGRIGGFVGQAGAGTTKVTINNSQVLTTGIVESKVGITAIGGFVGCGGDTKASVICNNCVMHGTVKHSATSDKGQRRIGGIIGDGSRIVMLTDCTVDGLVELRSDGTNIVQNVGGVVGNTTKQVDGHTMLTKLNNCVFSGHLKVYNVPAAEKTNTNRYGTLIGRNAATTSGEGYGLYIDDGAAFTSAKAVNYGTSAPEFIDE